MGSPHKNRDQRQTVARELFALAKRNKVGEEELASRMGMNMHMVRTWIRDSNANAPTGQRWEIVKAVFDRAQETGMIPSREWCREQLTNLISNEPKSNGSHKATGIEAIFSALPVEAQASIAAVLSDDVLLKEVGRRLTK